MEASWKVESRRRRPDGVAHHQPGQPRRDSTRRRGQAEV